jgi:hypothetical protein
MKSLFATAGVIEMLSGLSFVLTPSAQTALFFGASLNGPAETSVARTLGVALLALGLAFWLARNDVGATAARGVAVAMLVYNAGVVALPAVTALVGSRISAPMLWLVIGLHGGIAVWCGWTLRTSRVRPGAAKP